ncbi:MAG: MFS transporter, partial [Deltaproteobacteria bacterium]|nr:MFS transporter [Deltaproteobacteria bacterium]
ASMGIGFGTMLLTPLAGYIVNYYDWRSGFITFGVLIAVIGVGLPQLLMGKTNPEAYGWRPDGDAAGEHLPGGPREDHSVAVSLKPVLADRRFWILVVCFGMAIMTEMMAFIHQVNHAVGYGIDKIAAASSVGAIGIASIFGRFFFGWFSDRISDPKYSACLGFVVMAAGMFILMKTTTVHQLFFYALMFGFGYGSLAPMMPILLADRFGRYILGTAYGWLTFLTVGFGGMFGPIIGGVIYDSFGSYANAWVLNFVALLLVTILMVTLRRDDGKRPGRRSLGTGNS